MMCAVRRHLLPVAELGGPAAGRAPGSSASSAVDGVAVLSMGGESYRFTTG